MVQAPLQLAGQEWLVSCVSMGNPHAVVFGNSNGNLQVCTPTVYSCYRLTCNVRVLSPHYCSSAAALFCLQAQYSIPNPRGLEREYLSCLLKFGLGLAAVMLACGAALHRLGHISLLSFLLWSSRPHILYSLFNAAPHASITTAKPNPNFNKHVTVQEISLLTREQRNVYLTSATYGFRRPKLVALAKLWSLHFMTASLIHASACTEGKFPLRVVPA